MPDGSQLKAPAQFRDISGLSTLIVHPVHYTSQTAVLISMRAEVSELYVLLSEEETEALHQVLGHLLQDRAKRNT